MSVMPLSVSIQQELQHQRAVCEALTPVMPDWAQWGPGEANSVFWCRHCTDPVHVDAAAAAFRYPWPSHASPERVFDSYPHREGCLIPLAQAAKAAAQGQRR